MKTPFEIALKQYLEIQTKVVKQYVESYIKPLTILVNPETLMGRPFETWTPQDHQKLQIVYGPGKNPYTQLILEKQVAMVQQMKAETGG
jgi:hypothetical protein